MPSPSDASLDSILGLRFGVAWAGEALCEPPRLGWWSSDLVDADGGGDFLSRLAPRTAAWARFEAAVEVARRADARLRRQAPHEVLTLFHLPFEVEEALAARLAELRVGPPPETVLPALSLTTEPFDRERVRAWANGHARAGAPATRATTLGRALTHADPADPAGLAGDLVAALTPLPERYPMPYVRAP